MPAINISTHVNQSPRNDTASPQNWMMMPTMLLLVITYSGICHGVWKLPASLTFAPAPVVASHPWVWVIMWMLGALLVACCGKTTHKQSKTTNNAHKALKTSSSSSQSTNCMRKRKKRVKEQKTKASLKESNISKAKSDKVTKESKKQSCNPKKMKFKSDLNTQFSDWRWYPNIINQLTPSPLPTSHTNIG